MPAYGRRRHNTYGAQPPKAYSRLSASRRISDCGTGPCPVYPVDAPFLFLLRAAAGMSNFLGISLQRGWLQPSPAVPPLKRRGGTRRRWVSSLAFPSWRVPWGMRSIWPDLGLSVGHTAEPPWRGANLSIRAAAPNLYRVLLSASTRDLRRPYIAPARGHYPSGVL